MDARVQHMAVTTMKICTKCKEEKEESEFYNRSKAKEGLQSWCKGCAAIAGKEWARRSRSAYGGEITNRFLASKIARRQNFIAKYGKDIDDIIHSDEPERHNLDEFFD